MIVSSQLAFKTHTNFWMCLQPRNVRQTSKQVATTADSATYRRFESHSCYKACGTFNYVTNAYCDGTIIYNDTFKLIKHCHLHYIFIFSFSSLLLSLHTVLFLPRGFRSFFPQLLDIQHPQDLTILENRNRFMLKSASESFEF
jgi:hypothetical protein